jgi:hypothetical protein
MIDRDALPGDALPDPLPAPEESQQMPILDQRAMHGAVFHRAPDEIEAFWRDWALRKGFANSRAPDGSASHEIVERKEQLAAFVSDNRWVAECANCGGGIACWEGNDRGLCLDCGHLFRITFPPQETLAEAVALLTVRPPKNRHWHPEQHTIDDLKAENLLHGLPILLP